FSYDSVGNLLGITRRSSAILSVIDFAPKCGVTNDVITLSGTAFSLVANQNLVQFNGTPATVSSASATQLVVSLPAGVTSGTVSVTSPTGTTTSSQVFLPGVCGAS
ncbi:MAG: IPT/TIG domain-containing protein, partial [Candidatus Binatia bacterium]